MASLTNVTFPPEDTELLRQAIDHYRFDSVSAFFRACGQGLIAHYQEKDELISPLQFAASAGRKKTRRAYTGIN